MVDVDVVLEVDDVLDDVKGASVETVVVVVIDVGRGCKSSLDELPSPHDDRRVAIDMNAMMPTGMCRRC